MPYEGCRVHLKSSTRSNPYGSKSNSQELADRRLSFEEVSTGAEDGGSGSFGGLEGARQKTERNASNVPFFSLANVVAVTLGVGGGVGAPKPVRPLSSSGSAWFFFASRSLSFSATRSFPKNSSFFNLFMLLNSHEATLNGSKKLPDEKSHQHLSISLMTVCLLLLLSSSGR
jgi:hypothetical protein